jgi:hypothetical protein
VGTTEEDNSRQSEFYRILSRCKLSDKKFILFIFRLSLTLLSFALTN